MSTSVLRGRARAALRGSLAVLVAVTAGAALAAPAAATNVGTTSGNATTGCALAWDAHTILDVDGVPGLDTDLGGDAVHYSNGGYVTEVSPALDGSPGRFEIQHWMDGRTIHWRVFAATDRPVLGARMTLELPTLASDYTVEDLSTGFGAEYNARVGGRWTTPHPAEAMSAAEVALGDLPADSQSTILLTAQVAPGAEHDAFEAKAHLTGSYAQGAGCAVTTPPVPAAPVEGPCEQALAGRTVMSVPARDVEVRDKSGDGGETNADAWGAGATRTFRLYGATDRALTGVTYTARAAQGMTFRDPAAVDSPAKGLLPANGYTGAVEGVSAPVVGGDGSTVSVTIARMPARSAFSFDVVGVVDGTGAAMVIDHAMVGRLAGCAVTPPPGPANPPVDATPTPTPTPTPTLPPVTPGRPAPTPLVTRTFQVDRYTPRTNAQARALARLDDDRRLRYREDRPLWGASRHEFVTLRLPANATSAQVIRAIDATTSRRVGDVATTVTLRSAVRGRVYVVAWELGRGASTRAAWGPRHDVDQRFVARG